MTDLKQLAELALKMTRSNLAKNKAAGMVVVLGYPDGTIKQMPPKLAEVLSQGMNDAAMKDAIFGAVRAMAHKTGADKVVFATECWRGKSTEAARGMSEGDFRRLASEHKFETLVGMGMIERTEAIVATAQDATSVVIAYQDFRRLQSDGTPYSYGEVEVQYAPQEDFAGRQKMFGDLSPENTR